MKCVALMSGKQVSELRGWCCRWTLISRRIHSTVQLAQHLTLECMGIITSVGSDWGVQYVVGGQARFEYQQLFNWGELEVREVRDVGCAAMRLGTTGAIML
jgi:hypothetical protein